MQAFNGFECFFLDGHINNGPALGAVGKFVPLHGDGFYFAKGRKQPLQVSLNQVEVQVGNLNMHKSD